MVHLKSMIFQKRILKVAIICILATIWLISFAESARLVREGRSEQRAALAFAAEGDRLLDTGAVSERAFRAFQGNAGIPLQRSLLFGASSKLGTVLALVALVVPFGLSTLSILIRKGPHTPGSIPPLRARSSWLCSRHENLSNSPKLERIADRAG
jgi:hypothetical protein